MSGQWDHAVCDANDLLLDRLILDCNGDPVGMVDDLELGDVDGALVLTALLCGPTALGPRIGDRIGTWWLAVARRVRPAGEPYPVRIPMSLVTQIDRTQVTLSVTREQAGTLTLHDWVDDHVIGRIPGGQR
jgi:hypothetical protein